MPSDEASIALASAVRDLMDATVLTDCADDVLLAAVESVNAITAELSAALLPKMPWPDGTSMERGARPFSPVIGTANPLAPPVTVQHLPDNSVRAEITMRPIHEGPPEAVHGGWVAMLLDQILGHANAAAGVAAFTGTLTVRYCRPTPYGVPLVIDARTVSVDGRKVTTTGEIVAGGVVCAEASGLFIQPSREHVEQLRDLSAHNNQVIE